MARQTFRYWDVDVSKRATARMVGALVALVVAILVLGLGPTLVAAVRLEPISVFAVRTDSLAACLAAATATGATLAGVIFVWLAISYARVARGWKEESELNRYETSGLIRDQDERLEHEAELAALRELSARALTFVDGGAGADLDALRSAVNQWAELAGLNPELEPVMA